jgi:hypothetical protein
MKTEKLIEENARLHASPEYKEDHVHRSRRMSLSSSWKAKASLTDNDAAAGAGVGDDSATLDNGGGGGGGAANVNGNGNSGNGRHSFALKREQFESSFSLLERLSHFSWGRTILMRFVGRM